MAVKQPHYFDIITGESNSLEEAAAQAAFLIENAVIAAELNPVWRLYFDATSPRPVRLTVMEHGPGRADILLACGTWQGTLRMRVDEAGWVSVIVEADGRRYFSALADRPFEEVELRAAAALPFNPSDPPGRMGKRLNWLSLAVEHWPDLAKLTQETWFQADAAP